MRQTPPLRTMEIRGAHRTSCTQASYYCYYDSSRCVSSARLHKGTTAHTKSTFSIHCSFSLRHKILKTSLFAGKAYTSITNSPAYAEKPFITIDTDGKYSLEVPVAQQDKTGADLGSTQLNSIDFENVFVATSSVPVDLIQAKLDEGLHVVLSPGIYHLTQSLTLSHPNQVLLGIGLASLIAPSGLPCIAVKANTAGVRVAGVMLQAAPASASAAGGISSLLEWGDATNSDQGDAANPGVLSDIFARVGGNQIGTESRVECFSSRAQ